MKVTFKTVQGTNFSLEVEESEKIADVKTKVEQEQGAGFPAANQVLIYQGKVLKDDTTLADNKIAEAGFVVVMVTKTKTKAEPKPEPKPQASEAPTPPAAPAQVPVQQPSQPAPEAATETTPAQVTSAAEARPAGAYSAAASELVTGSALEEKISQICEMGFERAEVIRALRAAFNNPERAVEYLMMGIPETAEIPPRNTPPAANPSAARPPPVQAAPASGVAPAPAATGPNTQPLDMFGQATGAATGGAAGQGAGQLDFLRSNPQFQQLRQYVQANPQILQPMLQELGKQNPQLLQLINSNQAEFLRLIAEPAQQQQLNPADLAAQLAGGIAEGGGEEGEAMMPMQIQVTQEESEAIDRLEGLGFDRALCIEAFFACDKNEALAANYLLEHGNDDMQ